VRPAGPPAPAAPPPPEPATDETPAADGSGSRRAGRSGRWWSWPLRVALSVGMVWFLVNKIAGVAFTDVLPSWDEISLPWMAAALALTTVSIVLAAARWKQVLVAMDAAASPFPRLVSHYFAGQFVSNVLPTTIGGDVLRATRLAGDTGDSADSFASLIIERLTGWLVLPLLTLAGLALAPEVRAEGSPATMAMVIAGGTLVGLVVILYCADHPRLGGRYAEREGWRRFLGAVHLGVGRMRRHPVEALGVVAVGIVYQLVLVAVAVAAAHALGMEVGAATMVAVFPVVLMVQVLPIGISGVGLREWALVLFLTPLAVTHEKAVALGILVFGLNLLVSLLGAPAFLAGGGRARREDSVHESAL
jgi:uncharacterized membrane protein YbhN (UPF0104 family)